MLIVKWFHLFYQPTDVGAKKTEITDISMVTDIQLQTGGVGIKSKGSRWEFFVHLSNLLWQADRRARYFRSQPLCFEGFGLSLSADIDLQKF